MQMNSSRNRRLFSSRSPKSAIFLPERQSPMSVWGKATDTRTATSSGRSTPTGTACRFYGDLSRSRRRRLRRARTSTSKAQSNSVSSRRRTAAHGQSTKLSSATAMSSRLSSKQRRRTVPRLARLLRFQRRLTMTMTGLFGRSRNTRPATVKRLGLIAVGVLIGTFQLCGWVGLRINASPSLPVGLYIISSKPEANLAEFCPAEPFASLAISRGYRDRGACRDGATPLLKPVVARPGDVVEVSEQGIAVNGRLVPNTVARSADTYGRPYSVGRSAAMSSRPIRCGSLHLTKRAASTVATSVQSRPARFAIASGLC